MCIQIDKLVHCPSNWRFKAIWLQNEDFVTFIKSRIDLYFEFNTDQTGASTRWEAFKAYIRGEIISYTSSKSKQQKAEMCDLEKHIKLLEAKRRASFWLGESGNCRQNGQLIV